MAGSSSFIPRCAVELLFAEDLINRIMIRHTGRPLKAWKAAPSRDFIFNAFNDDIGEAVDFIDRKLEWEVDETFSKMVDEHRVNIEAFTSYARHFEVIRFKQGFNADDFLDFCVRLVSLAEYFDQYGKPLAMELALFYIVKVMTKYDLFEGGWDTLNTVAKKYVKRKEDFCNIITPDVSDDELLIQEEDVEADDEYYFQNEDGGFVVIEEEMPKDELDRQKIDLSASDENQTGRYVSTVDDESAINQEERPQDEPDRERMDLSGLDLHVTSKNETEEYVSNGDDESTNMQEETPQDKPDRERMDLSESKMDLLPVQIARKR